MFRDGITYDSAPESVYRADGVENGGAVVITAAFAAVDVYMVDDDSIEDDGEDDLLTYRLEGTDKDSFTITGTVDNNSVVIDALSDADGQLTFNGGADYESKRKYRVRIYATDPSGDSDSVDVIVNITNVNDMAGLGDEFSQGSVPGERHGRRGHLPRNGPRGVWNHLFSPNSRGARSGWRCRHQ